MKISEAYNRYIVCRIDGDNGSANTGQYYKYACRSALLFFGDINIKKLNEKKVDQYKAFLKTELKYAPNTARGHIVCLRTVLKMCQCRGEKVLDARTIKIPYKAKTVASHLSEENVKKFIVAAGEGGRGYPKINRVRNQLIVKMLFVTGMRISELCALNKDDIHGAHCVITGKSKDPRPCFIPEDVERMISEYLEMRSDNNPALFVSSQGGARRITARNVRRVFRRVCSKTGLEGVHPHTMRHSYGVYMIDHGVDIRILAALMGHQSLNTTKIYTQIADPMLEKEYRRVMG